MRERPMRVFESRKTGETVRVEVDSIGVTTYLFRDRHFGICGGTRRWDEMVPTPGAKPDWDYDSEIGVLERARWEEK